MLMNRKHRPRCVGVAVFGIAASLASTWACSSSNVGVEPDPGGDASRAEHVDGGRVVTQEDGAVPEERDASQGADAAEAGIDDAGPDAAEAGVDDAGPDADSPLDAGADSGDGGVDNSIVQIATGTFFTCARTGGGSVYCWGRNDQGSLGRGSQSSSEATPAPVVDLTDAVALALGDRHACARRSSGRVVCWGYSEFGIGDGTTMMRLTPTEVVGLDDAVEIASGQAHTCARRVSGQVVCWGSNSVGQIGDETTTDRLTPTAVSGLIDAVEIAAGGASTCARRASEQVVCWGSNNRGQLGDGTTTKRTMPTPVTDLTDVAEISVGTIHSCARRASGEVLCWGRNSSGQLGDGTTTSRTTPGPASISGAVALFAGNDYTCATQSSGSAFCWGASLQSAVEPHVLTPTQVEGLTDIADLSFNGPTRCALRKSGQVLCWGDNSFYQVGDGTNEKRFTPVPVIGLPGNNALDAGP